MERLLRAAKGGYLRRHWRRLGLYGLCGVAGALIVVQLAYPWSNLPLYETIDGTPVGGMSKSDAVKLLDKKYQNLSVGLYFGDNTTAYRVPHPGDIGLTIKSQPQVAAQSYPVWLRLVPTSLWWAHAVNAPAAPKYVHDNAKVQAYVQKELGKSCDVKPQNASVAYKDGKLQVVPAVDGGTCKLADVTKLIEKAAPRPGKTSVRIPMDADDAKIRDKTAADFAKQLTDKTKDVTIQAGDSTVAIPQATLLSWLDFAAPNSGLKATVNAHRAADFFAKQIAPKITVTAGTTHVSTVDFAETGRTTGASGQALDDQATIDLIDQWLGGADVTLAAKVASVSPAVSYSRTYTPSNTGLSALLTHFAQSHPGTYGISYVELTGQHRHAGYNDTKIFETASTYKLFVAYGTLKRIESGKWHWTDKNISNGRNLTKCFDDMIEISDNDCAKALLNKIGYTTLTNEIHAAGFTHSSFVHSYIETTPSDLADYLGMLQSGQLLSPSSTSTLLAAMRKNVYRQGVPSGTSGTVADKVGFLDPGYIQGVPGTVNLLHDASIVYHPSSTYVLVVMTGDSSWSTIAELTRQIESWR